MDNWISLIILCQRSYCFHMKKCNQNASYTIYLGYHLPKQQSQKVTVRHLSYIHWQSHAILKCSMEFKHTLATLTRWLKLSTILAMSPSTLCSKVFCFWAAAAAAAAVGPLPAPPPPPPNPPPAAGPPLFIFLLHSHLHTHFQDLVKH